MDWINKNDDGSVNNKDIPVKLNKEVIDYILSSFPNKENTLDNEAVQIARSGVVNWLREKLNNIEIRPSKIETLKNIIIEQHYKSLVVPAMSVGTGAAEALGATTTQMTLNTFHSSGSARSVSFGIDTMKDILFARKNPKNVYCTIYFKNKLLSLEEVLETKSYIVGSKIMFFVKDYKLGKFMTDEKSNFTKFEKYYWHEKNYVNNYMKNNNNKIYYSDNIDESVILRLRLNHTEMYKHKVSVKKLADVISSIDTNIIVLYGSIRDGIIDIIPKSTISGECCDKKLKDINYNSQLKNISLLEYQSYIELCFFEILIESLNNVNVKGIDKITNLYPKVIDILECVKEYKINNGNWDVVLNEKMMKVKGVSTENLINMFNNFNIEIIDATLKTFEIKINDDMKENFTNAQTFKNFLDTKFLNDKFIPTFNIIKDLIVEINNTDHDTYIIKFNDDSKINNVHIIYMFEFYKFKIINIPAKTITIKLPIINKPSSYFELYDFPIDNLKISDILLLNEENKISENKWKIPFINMNNIDNFKIILGILDIEIINVSDKDITISLKKNILSNPNTYIRHLIDIDKKLYTDNKIVNRSYRVKSTEYVIGETEGDNLSELLTLPQIDKTRTTCNNMFIIYEMFGIEAARNLIIKELMEVTERSYINPANIMLIAEFITSRGEPNGATYTGISRQPGGHLSLATLERAGKVFTQNAFCGSKEDIRNVSASIAVGTRMAIGDGMFDIGYDDENGVTYINDDIFKVKTNVNSQIIEELSKTKEPNNILDEILTLNIDCNQLNTKSTTTGLLYIPISIVSTLIKIPFLQEFNCIKPEVNRLGRSTRRIKLTNPNKLNV